MVRAVSSALLPLSHFVHYLGFSLAIGAAVAGGIALRRARRAPVLERVGLEDAAATIVTRAELPGLFVAVFGGILATAANPRLLRVDESGVGPWLHIKLVMVMALLVVCHLKMFSARRLVRQRSHAASEADCEVLARRTRRLDALGLALAFAIMLVATFRYALFG